MKDNPKYREQMLYVIRCNRTGPVALDPDGSLMITVGATVKDW